LNLNGSFYLFIRHLYWNFSAFEKLDLEFVFLDDSFGSKRVSKSTGIILNNGMDDFTANPKDSNYYGLPPSPSNLIAPGKRAQSSMSPVIVTDSQGDVRVVMGGSGGSQIISAIANVRSQIALFFYF
jgi:gamma-glutamyltranspeptidase / glutathione hydrolase / leukotriene-C4 hydrolase